MCSPQQNMPTHPEPVGKKHSNQFRIRQLYYKILSIYTCDFFLSSLRQFGCKNVFHFTQAP